MAKKLSTTLAPTGTCHAATGVAAHRTGSLGGAEVHRSSVTDAVGFVNALETKLEREFGGPDRDRTGDLIDAISQGEPDSDQLQHNSAIQNGSVHAGFQHVRCPLCVT